MENTEKHDRYEQFLTRMKISEQWFSTVLNNAEQCLAMLNIRHKVKVEKVRRGVTEVLAVKRELIKFIKWVIQIFCNVTIIDKIE
jgi:hypothetical protein